MKIKKLVSFILALSLMTVFCGCSSKDTASEGHSVDVEYYAKLGKMPETDYVLGDDIKELKAQLESETEGDDIYYNVAEGKLTTQISTNSFLFAYMNDRFDKGISYIVSFDDAYGFKQGDIIIEVKDALKKYGGTEEKADDKNAFFLPSTENCTILKYTFSSNVLVFAFQDNALCATAIYNSDNWTL